MTATTTDELGLIAAVCADPDDDTPRLVLADWLEENAGVVPCRHCGGFKSFAVEERDGSVTQMECDDCDSSGTASDGRAARAEFIRVQCEWAANAFGRHGETDSWCPCDRCKLKCDLRRREGELLVENWSKWFLPDLFPTYRVGCKNLIGGHDADILWTFRRGFVESLTLSWEAWAGVHRDLIWNVSQGRTVPATAQPIRELTLTTRPPYEAMRELADRHGLDWRPGDEPERWVRVLNAEFPDIRIHLPPA